MFGDNEIGTSIAITLFVENTEAAPSPAPGGAADNQTKRRIQ
jgi:hypothetical protein